ncbi:MAG: ABC transporter permease [Salinibacter sp.]|uniref:ABC transporter permease n=1 Tax=Salinibacter sp. TaxID=2065818 RepID=UPI0035D434B4
MLRNYVTTAVRSLRRHLGVTTLNVLGLGVGIGVSVLLLFFVRSELAVNDLFPSAERIYRIDSWQTDEEDRLRFISTNPLGETIEREAPGVEARTWLYGLWVTLGAEGDYYRRDTFLTNSEFFDVFDLPLRHGAPETALDEPRSAVLRADVARTLFGTTDVVGRTLDVQTQRHGSQSYTVTGVWEPLPRNSVTQFRGTEYKMLLSEGGTWDFAPKRSWSQWQSPFLLQYVRLAEKTDVENLHSTIENLVAAHAPDDVKETLAVDLSPLTDIYLTRADNAGWQRIYLVAALAALVLLIAGINFANLATARSLDRVREIGVRKTLGAYRGQLAGQFLVEAVLVSILATLLGAGLARLGQPLFEQLLSIEFVLRAPWDLVTIGTLAGLALVVGLLSGAYPAVVLSGFEPSSVFRDRLSLGWSAGTIRKGLVVVQFALAIVLMAGVYVLHEQLQFATNPDAPYPTDRMLVIDSAPRDFSEAGYRRIQTARDRLAAQPGVEAASVSWEVPQVGTGIGGAGLRRPEWSPSRTLTAGRYRVDPHFDETYDLTVTKGRFFRGPVTDDSTNVVLNEAAVEQLDLQRPVGAELEWENVGPVTVIGVVANFNVQNARAGIQPVVFSALQPGDWYRKVSVRLAAGASGAVTTVRSTWSEILPDAPFSYSFLDAKIARAYQTEQQTRRLVGAGAGLALFVALLGLIGLTGFTVRRRTTEIGIRKALGASMTNVVALLSTDIAKLVGIAILVGGPTAYLLARWWLQDFARRIALTPWPFLAVGLVALCCALVAISGHALQAARIDPATTLRDE